MEAKFKVGDFVKVVSNKHSTESDVVGGHGFDIGETVQVTSVEWDAEHSTHYYRADNENDYWYIVEDDLAPSHDVSAHVFTETELGMLTSGLLQMYEYSGLFGEKFSTLFTDEEIKAVQDTHSRGQLVDDMSIEEQHLVAKKLVLKLVGYNK